MKKKLNAKVVNALAPGKHEYIVFDATPVARGGSFGVRVTPQGSRSYIVVYRIGAKGARVQRKLTVGPVGPALPLEEARRIAAKWITEGREGVDRLADRRKAADAMAVARAAVQTAPTAPTMADLAEEYMARNRNKSAGEDERKLRVNILPVLGAKQVADVTADAVVALHRALSETAPIQANRNLTLLSSMFQLAVYLEWRPDNPVRIRSKKRARLGDVAKNPEPPRERFLTPEEKERLLTALAVHDAKQPASCNVIRLLLYTGCRLHEALAAEWTHFDLEAGIWTKPATITKQGKEHVVYLGALALELLRGMGPRETGYIFPAAPWQNIPCLRCGALGHLRDVNATWRKVRAEAGLDGRDGKRRFRLHDCRHSYASFAVSDGVPLQLVGALLGHSQASTTQRYAHVQADALRAAVRTINAAISAAPKAPAKVARRGRGKR